MPFQPGRAKTGGRRKGSVNKSILARQAAMAEWMRMIGLAPETIDVITPYLGPRARRVLRLYRRGARIRRRGLRDAHDQLSEDFQEIMKTVNRDLRQPRRSR